MVTTIPCLRGRWTVERSISASVVVTLVLIAITAAISISLAPANISFEVTQAQIVGYNNSDLHNNKTSSSHLNFTLVARNKSPRTEVSYDRVQAEIWYGPTNGDWVRTSAFVLPSATKDRGWHSPGSDACFGASADYGYSLNENVPNDSLVVVKAKVWFRYGLATTLPFTVKSSCWHVNFDVTRSNNTPIRCD